MKKIVLSLCIALTYSGFSQTGTPPPVGANPWYALDMDNDGSAPFDIAYFINLERAWMESEFGQSLAGYDIWAIAENSAPLEAIHYNTTTPYPNEQIHLTFTYNGNGPVFQDVEVNGWFLPLEFFNTIHLTAVPFDGDADNDGISNLEEDVNANGALSDDNNGEMHTPYFMDPDDDGDGTPTIQEDYNDNGNPLDDDTNGNGIPDYLDASVTLATAKFALPSFVLFPNPASDKLNVFVPNEKTAFAVIAGATGRIVLEAETANPIDVSRLSAGNYVVKITCDGKQSVQKLIVR